MMLRSLSTGVALKNPPALGLEQKFARLPKNIKSIIGLEVHAQLNTKAKLFSQGLNSSQASPNSHLDLLDVSIPGALPKLNGSAVRAAIGTGLALNCTIQDVIHFDRKNYFYTDMPAGFQITQYNKPIARSGHIDFIVTPYHRSLVAHSKHYDVFKHLYHKDRFDDEEFRPYLKRSHIKQIQLEQDSAKTLCQTGQVGRDGLLEELNNLVDYNRSGAGLLEIVFEPDLTNSHEASSLVRELIIILKTLKTCDCELQEGSLRVDANVSIESVDGQIVPKEDANRVELKNLNSLRSLNRGITYEIQRQAIELASGGRVAPESRTFDTRTGRSVILRAKETTVDYRYVPEPSIPPMRIPRSMVEETKREMESNLVLTKQLRESLERFNLELVYVVELIDEPGLAQYFMDIMNCDSVVDLMHANLVADFLIYALGNLKNLQQSLPVEVNLEDREGEFMRKLHPQKMGRLFGMLFANEISFANAYEVMKCLFTSDPQVEPRELVERFNWFQIHDEAKVDRMCSDLLRGMKSISRRYKKRGDRRDMQFMLDKLNELHHNRINIQLAVQCLNRRLRPEEGQGDAFKSGSDDTDGPPKKN